MDPAAVGEPHHARTWIAVAIDLRFGLLSHEVQKRSHVLALEIGVEFRDVAAALAKFGGVARRFDVHGTHDGATFVDDYAHLPSEIDAVMTGARDSGDGWNRIIAVFQRTESKRT